MCVRVRACVCVYFSVVVPFMFLSNGFVLYWNNSSGWRFCVFPICLLLLLVVVVVVVVVVVPGAGRSSVYKMC